MQLRVVAQKCVTASFLELWAGHSAYGPAEQCEGRCSLENGRVIEVENARGLLMQL